ncbi:FtsB family cell division protein [Govanella unica]|uniref:Septum formation initiator family protein n=1 Tax=Govanella unica TaxID=2975056 RepID=A0A9X3TY16_9PROT|nr:septum formation initiator family protein [Govania unica]MDA5193799.1 septum formation initiator family protein [Govania unica]
MKIWQEINPRLKSAVMPVLTVTFLGYFAYHAIEGAHGFKAWVRLSGEKTELQTKAVEAHARRAALENKVALLKPDNLDPDLLSERVRDVLGFAHQSEVVIYDHDDAAGPEAEQAAPRGE